MSSIKTGHELLITRHARERIDRLMSLTGRDETELVDDMIAALLREGRVPNCCGVELVQEDQGPDHIVFYVPFDLYPYHRHSLANIDTAASFIEAVINVCRFTGPAYVDSRNRLRVPIDIGGQALSELQVRISAIHRLIRTTYNPDCELWPMNLRLG
jgi:hypothetical protein